MKKILIIGFLLSFIICSCNIQNRAGEKALPENPCHIVVYNGSGIILDMEEATISAYTILNSRIIGKKESWLIYDLRGTDKRDSKRHHYKFCDSEALMIVWE